MTSPQRQVFGRGERLRPAVGVGIGSPDRGAGGEAPSGARCQGPDRQRRVESLSVLAEEAARLGASAAAPDDLLRLLRGLLGVGSSDPGKRRGNQLEVLAKRILPRGDAVEAAPVDV